MATDAHTNSGLRNSRRSIMGSGVRNSQATKPATRTTAAANAASTRGLVQPRAGASMIP